MSDLVPVKRALISVSDKTGLGEFAAALVKEFGVQLISTGGTAKFLREQGLPVTDVSQVTGFPEMMDGRVKTLHPKVHGGLLALRDNAEHVAAMKAHGIEPIDLVCINLYPFEKTVARPGVSFEEAIENIDIGGPSMVRSASKNHRFVLIVTSPADYDKVLGDLRKHGGSSCGAHRLKQAQKAFAHTAAYDARIAEYLGGVVGKEQSSSGSGPARHAQSPIHGAVAIAAPAEQRPAGAVTSSKPSPAEALQAFMVKQAVAVGGTEAVAFVIEPGSAPALRLANHVRPDDASEEARQRAIQAFHEIVAPCVSQGKDGAIEIGDSGDEKGVQYCLVTLLRKAGQPVGVTAVVARFRDAEMARAGLGWMQELVNTAAPDLPSDGALPGSMSLQLKKVQDLRYGENPHQKAALYVDVQPKEASVAYAKQLHGKELSYINLLDADAALAAVKELSTPAACVVKHATPCGYATADDLATAFRKAYEGDPLAAFGGIVALNKPVDLACAQAITGIDKLLEVIVAPAYAPEALELLRSRWKNVRLLAVGPVAGPAAAEFHMHRIVGGYLVQERDLAGVDEAAWKVVSQRQPTPQEMLDLKVAWLACKHLKSNAIALAKEGMMVGSGAGQQDRVNACRIAVAKGAGRAAGSVAASDAFFPFPDGPSLLLEAGITAIIHPGGSVRDQETLDVVNRAGAALVLTGQRHFKH